jgi:hypothetical protein
MHGELHGQLARWLRHDHRALGRRTFPLQEIADEVQVAATFLDVARNDRNAVVAEHLHDVAVTGSRLPDTRHRVQHIGLGVEQALDRNPRGWVRVQTPFG